ncbi:hypothetical protein [Aeromicrobium sp. UC242_57]|uniref:hypothetical protein n=1 Tax=Aeromicrobium sp. UC242_57 TaxID=3374624 RepID=UPI0037A09F49
MENTFRAVNIALINEFADICLTLDVDVSEVIDAAATKPYGYMAFRPGPGVGGHCIPCDPHYLLWQLRQEPGRGPPGHRGDAADRQPTPPGRRSDARPARRRQHVAGRQPGPGRRSLVQAQRGRRTRVSALDILQQLREAGASVAYVDPHVPSVRIGEGEQLHSIADRSPSAPHLVLLHTAHAAQDLGWMPIDQLMVDATYQADLSERGVTL